MALLRTTAANRFDSFDVYRTSYTKIGSHEIEANVLVPKGIPPGKRPVMIKWHGGGLVSRPPLSLSPLDSSVYKTKHPTKTAGTALYAPWFAAYLVPLLHRAGAIAILPNYRLVPEARGDDLLADVASFHAWFTTALPAFLAARAPALALDYARVLVSGESAGAWLALQSVLTLPRAAFAACLLQYPVLSSIATAPADVICGEPIPGAAALDAFLAGVAVDGSAVVSSAEPPLRSAVAPMLRAHGRWAEFFGDAPHLMPMTAVEGAAFWVPTYVVHGRGDTNVPVEATRRFADKVRARFPGTRVVVETPEGDHGFDGDAMEGDEGCEWLGRLMRGVEESWGVLQGE